MGRAAFVRGAAHPNPQEAHPMPTPQEQHKAELLALALIALHAASTLRSLRDSSKVHYQLLHIRIGRVLESAPPSAVGREVNRRPIALEA